MQGQPPTPKALSGLVDQNPLAIMAVLIADRSQLAHLLEHLLERQQERHQAARLPQAGQRLPARPLTILGRPS